jgi:hypothetical protein
VITVVVVVVVVAVVVALLVILSFSFLRIFHTTAWTTTSLAFSPARPFRDPCEPEGAKSEAVHIEVCFFVLSLKMFGSPFSALRCCKRVLVVFGLVLGLILVRFKVPK